MKHGFTLIEILISTTIAALMSTALLITIMQLNSAQQRMQSITSAYERASSVIHQFQRDIMGTFIPVQAMPLPKPPAPAKVGATPGTLPPPPTPVKKQPNPIDNIFIGTTKDGQLDTLTFITSNPLETYLSEKGKPKTRIARVVYRLEQDKKRKNSFNLMRQEGANLNFTAYTKEAKNELRPFMVIDGIASMSIMYIMLDEKEEKKGEEKTEKKKKLTYKKVKEWKQKKGKKKTIELPLAVEVTFELWDSTYEKKTQFTATIPLYGDNVMTLPNEKQDKKEKPAETKPQEQQAATPDTSIVAVTISNQPQIAEGAAGAQKSPATPGAFNTSWLKNVTLGEGASITINGEKYVPS